MATIIRLEKEKGSWSHQRSRVPTALAQRGVQLVQWQETFDKMEEFHQFSQWQRQQNKSSSGSGGSTALAITGLLFTVIGIIFLPLFIVGITLLTISCCMPGSSSPPAFEQSKSFEFSTFVQSQQDKYACYQIKVWAEGFGRSPSLSFFLGNAAYAPPAQGSVTAARSTATPPITVLRLQKKFGSWSLSASRVPEQLARAGVGLQQWQNTHNKMEEYHRYSVSQQNNRVSGEKSEEQRKVEFAKFLNSEQAAYKPFHVQVSSDGPTRFPALIFSVKNDFLSSHPNKYEPPTEPAPTADLEDAADPKNLVATLQSLHTLHQSGALTDEEFDRAKSRVLSRSTPGGIPTTSVGLEESNAAVGPNSGGSGSLPTGGNAPAADPEIV